MVAPLMGCTVAEIAPQIARNLQMLTVKLEAIAAQFRTRRLLVGRLDQPGITMRTQCHRRTIYLPVVLILGGVTTARPLIVHV